MELYYYPGNASLAPHFVLRELELPHQLVLVDRERDAQKATDYLALNPHGRIPTLVDGGFVLYESAALCIYLADKRPGHIAPSADDSEKRALMYQWMFFLSNTVQPKLMSFHYPANSAKGDECVREVSATAEVKCGQLFAWIDETLAKQRYLLGDRVSICDYYLLMLCRWARTFSRSPRQSANLGPLLATLIARPAVEQTFSIEGIEAPYV
ncbi:MAG: glutathione S-transferase family protein [Haliangiales bacterium]